MIHAWSQSCDPSSYHPFFIPSSKNSLPPIFQSRVRSDPLLSSIPLPPSAICHSRLLAAKQLFWFFFFKAHTVSHSTFSWLNKLFLVVLNQFTFVDPDNNLTCTRIDSSGFYTVVFFCCWNDHISPQMRLLNVVFYCPYSQTFIS